MRVSSQILKHFKPVFNGHADIQKQEIDFLFPQELKKNVTVGGYEGLIPFAVKNLLDKRQNVLIIIKRGAACNYSAAPLD